jgi:hypothetical protein
MTYPSLLTAIYSKYDRLLPAWESEREKAESIGVFAFFPDDYGTASGFDECRYSYWPTSQVTVYLQSSGLTDDGYRDLLDGFEDGEQFLVMIVEQFDDRRKKAVHIHKITRVGAN